MLISLQRQAQRAFAQHYTAPQRYGTAFHVVAPYADLRELPVEKFATPADLKMGPAAALRPCLSDRQAYAAGAHVRRAGGPRRRHPFSSTQFKTFTSELNDPYLLWHLSHVDVLPVHTLTVPAGEKRELTLAPQNTTHISNVVLLELEEGSSLTVHDVARTHALYVQRIIVRQQARSTFTYWGMRERNAFASEAMTVHLLGEEATAAITHLVVQGERGQADMSVRVRHVGPHTSSDVHVRTVATNKGRVVYRGLIDVGSLAHGTRGYQQGRALLMSRQAVVDMLPQLEIATNDVRCSHGVTTTHLDDAALFYLRSRGLGEASARQLAVQGFFHQQLQIPQLMKRSLTQALTRIV